MSWMGTWRNQLGSTLEINGETGGLIQGTYTSAKGNVTPGKACSVVGYCQGNMIAFATDFGDGRGIAAWTGLLDAQTHELHAMWHLVDDDLPQRDGTTRKAESWEAFRTGKDVFTPVPSGPGA